MLEEKIEKYINEKFKPIYAISMIYPTYLIGGSIIDILLDNEPRDLDFVILSHDSNTIDEYLQKFIGKFQLNYKLNHFNGYKIIYNDYEIDLWHTKDLLSSIEYNADGILYDIENKNLISISFDDYLKNGPKRINNTKDNNNKSNTRYLKLERKYNELKKRGLC